MDLLQLQYFRAIAQHENMTKAAEALFASQPNLSTSMSRLESDLDVKLFERRRGHMLTPASLEFFAHLNEHFGEESRRTDELFQRMFSE